MRRSNSLFYLIFSIKEDMGKIFGTDGIRCIVNTEPLTAETTLKISKTAGYLLKSKKAVN